MGFPQRWKDDLILCLLNSTTVYWCLVSFVQYWSRTLCLPPFQWCTKKQHSVWRFPRLDKAISSSLYWHNLCHHLGGLLWTHSTALISFFYKDLQTRHSTLHEASKVVNRGERLPSEGLYRKWRPWEKKINPSSITRGICWIINQYCFDEKLRFQHSVNVVKSYLLFRSKYEC